MSSAKYPDTSWVSGNIPYIIITIVLSIVVVDNNLNNLLEYIM